MKRIAKPLVLALSLVFAFIATQPVFATTPKISVTPSAIVFAPGETQTIQLQLVEPIICSGGVLFEDCKVTVDFTSSLPAGITMDHPVITWQTNEWFQPRTAQLTFDANASRLSSTPVQIQVQATSPSEYYSNYAVSFSLSSPEPSTPTPTPTPTSTPTPTPTITAAPSLASTGSSGLNLWWIAACGALLLGGGIFLVRAGRK